MRYIFERGATPQKNKIPLNSLKTIIISSLLTEGTNLIIFIMNAILSMILDKREGHYVHALEVSDVYELQSCIESLYNELIDEYSIDVFIDFITSMELYCLEDENEDEVYNFDIVSFIKSI